MARVAFVLVFLLLVTPAAPGQTDPPDVSRAGNEQVAEIIRTFGGRGVMADDSQPTDAATAVTQFRMLPGCAIDLVAAEPEISQPLFLSWDSRGRMWVVQYRQYQYPAGLKVIRFDQHLRAVFDKTPEPPPRGVPGDDRITVFEDTDGDGRYDRSKDVITGLNIATSVQVGAGGIWVLNPPYLLFYPDADGDDVPDSDPEVHLSGFGLQDTHSVANSLLWGPDGWLYGANGSTTVGNISSAVNKGVHFDGQCIWRYHPRSKRFEIYAEGGGNTFSLEIDRDGRVFSGTNGGGTRGFYYPQGSYSHKNWGKHGPLTNPYAFGFFQQMESVGDPRRFPQAFMIYEGGIFPPEFNGSIVAPNSLHNLIWHCDRIPQGSTFRTEDRPNLVETPDRWFRPVYVGSGPDGAIYVADWYDTRLSHVSPIDDWHKTSGRIYRIRPITHEPRYEAGDLQRAPVAELLVLLDHPNRWVRQRATLEIGWRGETAVVPELVDRVTNHGSLEALWAIHLLEELTTERARQWLHHDRPVIRTWVVRLLGDRHESLPELADLAANESDLSVRCQLACTAKRIDAGVALSVVRGLLQHDEDAGDPHLPLLIWWAIEAHADQWSAMEHLVRDPNIWKRPLMLQTVATRLMQRYATAGTPDDLRRCEELLALAPDNASKTQLLSGLDRAFQGRPLPLLPNRLNGALAEYQSARGDSPLLTALRQNRFGSDRAAVNALRDGSTDLGVRIALATAMGEIDVNGAADVLVRLATGQGTDEPALQRVALQALANYDEPAIAGILVAAFDSSLSAEHNLRDTACRTLASRRPWALALLAEINAWRIQPRDVPADVVQQLRTYTDEEVMAAVKKAFGPPAAVASDEKRAQIERLRQHLVTSIGDVAQGKQIFMTKCGICHELFGEGSRVGPPLDSYDRGNVNFWLNAVVEPSLEIREGYQSYVAVDLDGRVMTGLIDDQNPTTVTLRTAENQRLVLTREELDVLQAIGTSLMPEGLLNELTDPQVADLFAYLRQGISAAGR